MQRILSRTTLAAWLILSGPNALAHDFQVLCSSDWPVWEISRGMQKQGLLHGFLFHYRPYNTCVRSFKQGSTDATFMTLYDFIYSQVKHRSAVVVAATDHSVGGDKFYVRNDISTPQALKGQTLLLQSNSISLWLAHLYLQRHGMSLDDVTIAEAKGEDVGMEFMKFPNLYAGAVGWNPNFQMIKPKHGRLVASSADFPGEIFDVLVVQRKSLQEHRQLYQNLIDDWFTAINDESVIYSTAEAIKVDVNQFRLWLVEAEIYRTKAASLDKFPEMREAASRIRDFFSQAPPAGLQRGATRENFGQEDLDTDLLFDDSLLRD